MTACRIVVIILAALCSSGRGLRDESLTDDLSQEAGVPAEAESPPAPADPAAEPQVPEAPGPQEQAAEAKEADGPPRPSGQEAAAPEAPGAAEDGAAAEAKVGGPAEVDSPPKPMDQDAAGAGEASPEEAEEAESPGEEVGPVDLSQETATTTLVKQFKLNTTKNKYNKKVFLFCKTKDEWMASKTEAEMKNAGKLEYEPGKLEEVRDPFWVCYNPATTEKFKVEKKDAIAARPKKFESTDKLPAFEVRSDWPRTPSYDKFVRARKYLQRGEIYAIQLEKKMEQALTDANSNKDWGGLLTPPPSWTARDPLKLVVGGWVRCPYPDCEEVIPMSAELFRSTYEKVK